MFRKPPDDQAIKEEIGKLRSQIHTLTTISIDHFTSQDPRYADPKRLLKYGAQVNSQNREDGMIQEIFRRIGTTNRVFAEVGVGNGVENNTAFLLALGWTGFWIDGSDDMLKTIESRGDLQNGVIKALASFVTKENAASLFEQLGVPRELDVMSLDIDQNTYYLWEGLQSYRPRVVVIEYNATIPPQVDWKVRYEPNRSWNWSHNFGASLKAYELLGKQFGYSLVGCDYTGCNAFFVRDDLLGEHFAAPYTSENHYEPARYFARPRQGHGNEVLDRISND